MDLSPSQTLYINNINEKVKIDVLKKMFYMVFSQYGKVTEIVAKKGVKMRGQAWVVFQDTSAATNALRGKQGFNFYGKPLRIQYAKSKSDTTGGRGGVDDARAKRKREDDDGNEDSNAFKAIKVMSSDVPNRILFAQNLPMSFDAPVLTTLFQQCPGFQEVRTVPGNPSIAFIEFGDEVQAGMALRQLQNFQITADQTLHLTFSNQ